MMKCLEKGTPTTFLCSLSGSTDRVIQKALNEAKHFSCRTFSEKKYCNKHIMTVSVSTKCFNHGRKMEKKT